MRCTSSKSNDLGDRLKRLSAGVALIAATAIAGCQSASIADKNADPISTASIDKVSFKETAAVGKKWRENPGNLKYGLDYARRLKSLGRKKDQLDVIDELVKRHPDNIGLIAYQGKELAQAGQAARAEQVLRRVVDAGKADWKAYSGLGSALDQQGKHAEARRYYGAALKSRPNEISVLNNMGMSYLLEGDLKQAEKILRKAHVLPAGQKHPQIRQNLALSVGLQGRFDEAKQIASQDLPPNIVEANMAYLRKMLSQRDTWQKLKPASGANKT